MQIVPIGELAGNLKLFSFKIKISSTPIAANFGLSKFKIRIRAVFQSFNLKVSKFEKTFRIFRNQLRCTHRNFLDFSLKSFCDFCPETSPETEKALS